MTCPPTTVQWPGNIYDPTGSDLSKPLQDLLIGLNLLEKPGDLGDGNAVTRAFQTPVSVQVITAGASALSKGWTALAGLVGGGGAVAAAIKGLGGDIADHPVQRAVFVGSAAVVLAATVVAIAIIVRADVSSRADATAAEYRARAEVVSAVVSAFQQGNSLPTLPKYWIQRKEGNGQGGWHPVVKFKRSGGKIVAVIQGDRGLEDVPEVEVEGWRADQG